MIKPNLQVMTRDGRAARIVSVDSTHQMGGYRYPIQAEVESPNNPGEVIRWHYMANGQWKSNDACNGNDLVHPYMAQKIVMAF